MVIDMHTHVYPDKIAGRVIELVRRSLDVDEAPSFSSPMTIAGLLEAMDRCGVDSSVTFCIAERPEVVRNANDYLIEECDGKRLIPFGTIHPGMQEYEKEIDRLRINGVKGVKWSSIFQSFRLDEDRMMRIYEAMGDDMIAYFHMGRASGKHANHMNSTPAMLARVLDTYPKMKVVAAHFGGLGMLDEARNYLFGRDLYLDTVWTLEDLDANLVAEVIKEHGASRILFGSDYPFGDACKDIDFIRKLPLGDDDKELVLWRNAKELLGI